MPQGRHKVPFSAKQKKQQLKEKRDQKREQNVGHRSDEDLSESGEGVSSRPTVVHKLSGDSHIRQVKQMNVQNRLDKHKDVNRFALQFFEETAEELRERRENSRKPFEFLTETALEISVEEVFTCNDVNSTSTLDLPKRPKWDSSMTPNQLEWSEQKYFREYLDTIHKSNAKLSYFELNLETWRQLWRVLEMSDIILLIADIRHPVFHFPPSLYNYVINELKKDMILVLNKIDLVDSPLVIAWTQYLKKMFPELNVISFASYAGMKVKNNKKRIGKLRMASNAAKELQSVCQNICGEKVDLSNWRSKIEQELHEEELAINDDSSDEDIDSNPLKTGEQRVEKFDLNYYNQTERFTDGVVTIGCVGHPNVGKSSLLNSIMGKKVVSVSRTPGHTKHFQTIYLTPTVRLCDCPGLVFPSRAPKELQVLMGCFPIAQLREPYSAVGYLAQRVPLHKILRLVHPNQEGNAVVEHQWSAYDICESWAIKRGFLTAKAARPDVYRAANHLLRMALDGRTLCLAFYPPNYVKEKDIWAKHPDIKFIDLIKGQKLDSDLDEDVATPAVAEEEESEEEDESESEEETSGIATKSKFAVLMESD